MQHIQELDKTAGSSQGIQVPVIFEEDRPRESVHRHQHFVADVSPNQGALF